MVANYCFLMDPAMNSAVEEQAIDRYVNAETFSLALLGLSTSYNLPSFIPCPSLGSIASDRRGRSMSKD